MDSNETEQWKPNEYEKDLVKLTWNDDFDFLYELGSAIYTYIFENNPNTKQLFPEIHNYGEKWKESKEFRSLALKFVQVSLFNKKLKKKLLLIFSKTSIDERVH